MIAGQKPTMVVQTQAINANGGADVIFTLPSRCVKFTMQSRTAVGFRVGHVTGGIAAGNYLVIDGAATWDEEGRDIGGRDIYLRSDTAGAHTLEIITWAAKGAEP